MRTDERTDGQTLSNLIVAFRNFENGPTKTGNVYVKRNTEARSCNHCYSGKQVSITYYECVFVALGIKHEMYMRRIILSGQLATVAHLELCFMYKSNLPMLADLNSYAM